jgi:3D (Asp-Asp-Asp) domain-containing protein
MGFFGALIIIIIVLLLFLAAFIASIASTLGPIALVIAAIVKSFRNSAPTGSPGLGSPGTTFTMSSGERVIAVDPSSTFGQAFGATLQGALGQQLGQKLGQMVAMAAAQHPLELQLAPIVMAVEAARRDGNLASVRPFLTDRFAAMFTAAGPAPAGIAHLALASKGAVASGDHVVIRIERGTTGSAPSEYWSFQRDTSVVPDGTPVVCPQCGAPTAGDSAGACRFCGATFSTAAPALPEPVRWLLDDISGTPPALAA